MSATEHPQQSHNLKLLEGAEKFLKTTEIIGKYLQDFKEFTHYTDGHISRLDADLATKVTKAEFQAKSREKSKKLKNKLKILIGSFDDRLSKLEKQFTTEMDSFRQKQQEIELNTYWKIKDYEDLLRERISETFLKDYTNAETQKVTRAYEDLVDHKYQELQKKLDILQLEQSTIKELSGDKLDVFVKSFSEYSTNYENEKEHMQQRLNDQFRNFSGKLEQE